MIGAWKGKARTLDRVDALDSRVDCARGPAAQDFVVDEQDRCRFSILQIIAHNLNGWGATAWATAINAILIYCCSKDTCRVARLCLDSENMENHVLVFWIRKCDWHRSNFPGLTSRWPWW